MTFHIVFIILLFLTYYATGGIDSERNQLIRKRQVAFMGFLLFLFAGLRAPTVGTDLRPYETTGYWNDYIITADMSFAEIFDMREGRDPIFYCFLKMLSFISDDPQFMLITIGAIFAFGFSYFVYYSKGNVLLTFMMLIGFRIFSFSLSGLRQAVALGIIYVAYVVLRDKKYLFFVILTSVAALFHNSALIFILALPLSFFKGRYVVVVLLLLLIANIITNSIFLDYWATTFFNDRFESYLEKSTNMAFEGSGTFFLYMLFYFFILISYRKIKNSDAEFDKDFNVLSVGIFYSVLGQSMDSVFRLAYYFIFLLFPATSVMIQVIVKDKTTYHLSCFFASFLLAVQFILLGTGAETDNYEFFWTFHN